MSSTTTNYSLLSIPAMWLVTASANIYATGLTFTSNDIPVFKNVMPREFWAGVEGQEKQSAVVKRALRGRACQANGFENIGLFAAAVLAGNQAGLPASTMNKLSFAYVATRSLFNILYITTTNEALSFLRTGTFFTGLGIVFTMFWKASKALNEGMKL